VGEILTSPTEDWKPDFKRKQSYKQEDLKREMQMAGVIVQTEEGAKDGSGEGRGAAIFVLLLFLIGELKAGLSLSIHWVWLPVRRISNEQWPEIEEKLRTGLYRGS